MAMLAGDFNPNHGDDGRFTSGSGSEPEGHDDEWYSRVVKYKSHSDFPKFVKYEGEEYYNLGAAGEKEMSEGGPAQVYVRWDDDDNEQYISVNMYGEIERE